VDNPSRAFAYDVQRARERSLPTGSTE
jgi:hypothetical protein